MQDVDFSSDLSRPRCQTLIPVPDRRSGNLATTAAKLLASCVRLSLRLSVCHKPALCQNCYTVKHSATR